MKKIPLTRRTFLKGLGAAVAFPTIIPARVLGQDAPSKKVQLAAIGCGSRARTVILKDFAGLPDVRFVAAVDPFRQRREEFAGKLDALYGAGTCKPYEDFREIIGSKEIDGVVVTTPDHWHVPVALEAAKAKKDMYVEKPLGVSMKLSRRLFEACEANRVVFQYGTQQRAMMYAHTAVDIVRNGYIGKVESVDVWSPHLDPKRDGDAAPMEVPEGFNYDLYTGPAEKKPFVKDRATTMGSWHCYEHAIGFIAGWGAHPLDICQWGLDADGTSPVHYEGTGLMASPSALWNTTRQWDIHAEYANGVKMHFMDETTAKPVVAGYTEYFNHNGTTFHGTEGWVCFSREGCYLNLGGKMVNISKFQFRASDKHVNPSRNHAGNFVECMKSRKPTISPIGSALHSDAISHLSDIVIRTGKPVKWDPAKYEIVGGTPEQISLMDRPMREPYKV